MQQDTIVMCHVCMTYQAGWECRGCKKRLCTPCLVEVAGGRLLCPHCDTAVAKFRQVR